MNSKRLKKIANTLVRESASGNGVDHIVVRRCIGFMLSLPYPQSLLLMIAYKKQLARVIAQKTLIIETAGSLDQSTKSRLIKFIRDLRPVQQTELLKNPTLLGGLKLTIGDTVYDASLLSKIGKLKDTFYA